MCFPSLHSPGAGRGPRSPHPTHSSKSQHSAWALRCSVQQALPMGCGLNQTTKPMCKCTAGGGGRSRDPEQRLPCCPHSSVQGPGSQDPSGVCNPALVTQHNQEAVTLPPDVNSEGLWVNRLLLYEALGGLYMIEKPIIVVTCSDREKYFIMEHGVEGARGLQAFRLSPKALTSHLVATLSQQETSKVMLYIKSNPGSWRTAPVAQV